MNLDHFRRHLEDSEGRRNKPYLDNATPPRMTIGCGRNLTDKGLSDAEIDFLMENDIADVLAQVGGLPYWNDLNDARQLVVSDMAFNLGFQGFLGFVKLQAALTVGDYDDAAEQMVLSKWYRQVGRRAVRLVTAMRSGVWQEEST